MFKVLIQFNDGAKICAIARSAEVVDGILHLDLGDGKDVHLKVLPLHNIDCVDITPTYCTRISYDKA